MRIVSRKEFLELPVGTVYARYLDRDFGVLEIKQECKDNDWWYSLLVDCDGDSSEQRWDFLAKAESDSGFDLQIDTESWIRDGRFEDSDRFVVFSLSEIKQMIVVLQKAIVLGSIGVP